MKCKRLTEKKLRDTDIYPVLDENGNVIVDRRLFNRFIEQHNRLAELEDKIEQGTLIELPCKVGDTIYIPWVYDDKSGVSFHEITRIEIYKNSIDLCFYVDTDIYYVWVYIYSQGRLGVSELGNKFFLTREEAETRLKELQG